MVADIRRTEAVRPTRTVTDCLLRYGTGFLGRRKWIHSYIDMSVDNSFIRIIFRNTLKANHSPILSTMHPLEPEYLEIKADGVIDEPATIRTVALERDRRVLSSRSLGSEGQSPANETSQRSVEAARARPRDL